MEEQINQGTESIKPVQIIINGQETPQKNGLGIAGFIIAIIALFTDWVPVLGWVIWVLGAIFSIIGLFRKPRGLAIAGAIISFIGLVILIAVVGIIGAASILS